MSSAPDPRTALPERLFTVGSATMFLLLMSAVTWALAAPNALLK
jgi:hypothetical protein